MSNEIKEMNLEEFIAETEQKILNNEYYEDVDIEYKDTMLHVRIKLFALFVIDPQSSFGHGQQNFIVITIWGDLSII